MATPWRRVGNDVVRQVLSILREFDSSLETSDLPRLSERFGLRTTASPNGKDAYIGESGADLNAPWEFGGHEASFQFWRGRIERVTFRLTDLVTPATPESTLFMQDAFADYAKSAIELLGSPTRRRSGPVQELHWRGRVMTVALVKTQGRVSAGMATNDYYDDIENSIEVDT